MIINYNEQSIVTFMYNNEEWLRKKKKNRLLCLNVHKITR